MATCHWEHFHHESDIGIRGIGATLETAFEQAAYALTAVVTEEPISSESVIEFSLESPDLEFLLVDWLNALIFEMATRSMIFSRFEVHLEESCLKAKVWGEPVSVEKHHPAVEVKGATLSELRVQQLRDGNWLAQCVVDV